MGSVTRRSGMTARPVFSMTSVNGAMDPGLSRVFGSLSMSIEAVCWVSRTVAAVSGIGNRAFGSDWSWRMLRTPVWMVFSTEAGARAVPSGRSVATGRTRTHRLLPTQPLPVGGVAPGPCGTIRYRPSARVNVTRTPHTWSAVTPAGSGTGFVAAVSAPSTNVPVAQAAAEVHTSSCTRSAPSGRLTRTAFASATWYAAQKSASVSVRTIFDRFRSPVFCT